ncbi:MAG: dTDP-fucosamine acetyltransferase [Candidatus Heimdallarchaeota archaeon LC_3]|nr:MAG: dTDP-fucosamine acetyltransferase [Candidatus Heimdallarchaeota archaeon LC_3]
MSQVTDNIFIREISIPDDGEHLATLFNEFNNSWEGGFMGEGENTKETALDIATRLKLISIFVAEDENKELVGYCSLHPHYQDAEACYVGILGVHTRVMDKKIGKKLMLKSLERASIEGFQRLDLGTWAGNIKAMPLYKKLGLKWVPDTSVQMECYIPLILNQSLFKPFWDKHPDWYSNFKLEITQAPDEEKYQDLDAYVYKFECKSDYLYVWIDRYAKTIIAFDYKINEQKICIGLQSSSNKGFRGVKYPFLISIDSTSELYDFSITSILSDGVSVDFSKEIPSSLKNDTVNVILNPEVSVSKYKSGYKGLISTFKFKWGEKTIDLSIGLKIESAIEIDLIEDSKSYHPNYKEKAISFMIKKNIEDQIIGKFIIIEEKDVECSQTEYSIDLPSKDLEMITIPIKNVKSSNKFSLKALIEYESLTQIEKEKSKTEDFIFNVPILQEDLFLVFFDHLTTEHLRVYNGLHTSDIDLRGGLVRVGEKNNRSFIRQGQQLGPPFGFDEFSRLIYDFSIDNNIIDLIGKSEDRPGIILRKKVYFTPSSPLIKIEIVIENQSEKDQSFSVRLNHFRSLNPSSMSYFLPIGGKIVEIDGVLFPRSFVDLGTSPDRYSESWVASQLLSENQVIGLIWSPNEIMPSEVRIDGNQFVQINYPIKIKKKSTKLFGKYWLYQGTGDWRIIRQYWKMLSAPIPIHYTELPELEKTFAISFENIKKTSDSVYSIDIILKSNILAPVKGELYLETVYGEFTDFPLKFEIDKEKSILSTFTITAPLDISYIPVQVKFKLQSGYIIVDTELDIFTSTDIKEPFIQEEIINNMEGFSWKHQKFNALSVPEYSAGFTWIKNADNQEILNGPFPKYTPLFFLPKNQGGLNFLFAKEFEDIIQGKAFLKYKGEIIRENNLTGLKFILGEPKKSEELPEIIPELKILGNPLKSNVKLRIKLTSICKSSQGFMAFLALTPKPDEEFTIEFIKDKEIFTILPSSDPRSIFATPDSNTAIKIKNKDLSTNIEIIPSKKHYSFGLIVDFAPTFNLIGFFIPIIMKSKEILEYEYEIRFN